MTNFVASGQARAMNGSMGQDAPKAPKGQKINRDAVIEFKEWADDLYLDAATLAKRRELRLTENLAFFRGYQWGVPLRDGLYENYADIDPRVEAEVNNFIAGAVRTDVARAFRNPVNFSVVSAGDTALGRVRARNTELLSKSLLRANILPFETLFESRTAAAIFGAGWLKVIWNPYKGRTNPVGNPPFVGDVDWQYVSVMDCFPDPRATDAGREMRYIFHRKYIPTATCEDMWPVDIFGEETEGKWQLKGARTHFEAVSDLETSPDALNIDGNELSEVVEYWERPTNRYPMGRFLVYSGSIVVHAGPLPYEFPWVLVNGPNKPPGTLYSDGLVHHLKSIQRSINLAASKAREIINVAANPPLLVEENSNVQEDSFENLAGTIIRYRERKPEWMPSPDTNALDNYQTFLQKVFSDVSTYSDVAGGQPPAPGTSARAIAYMAELNQGIHVPDDIMFETTIIRALTLALEICRANYEEGRLLKIIGPHNQIGGKAFKQEDYDFNVELVIDPFSPRNLSPAVKRAEVSEYFGMGLFDDSKPGSATARRLMEINSDDASTLDIHYAHRRRAEDEDACFSMIAEGDFSQQVPQVLPQDNDDVHLECHEHTSVTEWLAWPPEVQDAFMQHVAMHEMQWQGKLGQFSEEQGMLGPKGAGPPGAGPPGGGGQPMGPGGPGPTAESPTTGGHPPLPESVSQEPPPGSGQA